MGLGPSFCCQRRSRHSPDGRRGERHARGSPEGLLLIALGRIGVRRESLLLLLHVLVLLLLLHVLVLLHMHVLMLLHVHLLLVQHLLLLLLLLPVHGKSWAIGRAAARRHTPKAGRMHLLLLLMHKRRRLLLLRAEL